MSEDVSKTDIWAEVESELGKDWSETAQEPKVEEAEVKAEPAEIVQDPVASESSTDEDEDKSKDWREKRMSKMAHKNAMAQAKIKELEEKLAKAAPVIEAEVRIPDAPDPDLYYTNQEEYTRQLSAHKQALIEAGERSAMRKLEVEQRQRQQQELDQAKSAKVQDVVKNYIKVGTEAGLSDQRMQYNEAILQEAEISTDLAEYLYSDERGPLIVDHLVNNPTDLGAILNMPPLRAAEYIATKVKPMLSSVKPRTTQAPDPVSRVKGGGSPPVDEWDSVLPAGYKIS
jgi:hypothetical protein